MNASPQGSSAAPAGQRPSQEIERVPRISVTWMGHSTVLVEVDGVRILTDPLVTRRLAHLRRRAPTPTVDPVDAVLISHVHMDHLHLPSLRRTASGARLIVPDGAGRLVRRLPVRSIEEVRHGAIVRLRDAREREVGGRCRGCPRPPPFGSRSALERDRAAGRVRGAGQRGGPSTSPVTPISSTACAHWGRSTWRCCRSGDGAAHSANAISTRRPRRSRPVGSIPPPWSRSTGARTARSDSAWAPRLDRSAAERVPRCARRPRAPGPSLPAATGRFVAARHRRRRQLTRATGPAHSRSAHRRRLALALAACRSAAFFLAACRCQIAVTMTAPTIEPMRPLGRRARPSPASRLTSSPPMNDPANPATRAIPQSSRETDRPNSTCAEAPTSIPKPSIAKISTAVP